MADSAIGVDAELFLDTEEPELMELMIKSRAEPRVEDSIQVAVEPLAMEKNEAELLTCPSGADRGVLPDNDPEVDELLRGSSVCDGDVCG